LLQHLIRQLPPWVEMAIVISFAFGYSILSSLHLLFSDSTSPPISSTALVSLIIYEACVLVMLWGFLTMRGWTFEAISLRLTVRGVLAGACLAAGIWVALEILWVPVAMLFPAVHLSAATADLVSKGLPVPLITVASLLNPVYEEIFVCGYLITAVEKMKGITTAVNASVAIRLLYHLYQGAPAIAIVPIGLIFAFFYIRTRQLWPIVVAHGINDFASLLVYS
jgi:membrane protease YdiL (CAAX protease family)